MTLVALFLLNFALSLQNIWPTPAVTWAGQVSAELAGLLLILVLLSMQVRRPVHRLATPLTVLLLLLTLGHYVDVTSPALYGRPINLYWDMPHVGSVIGMTTRVVPVWQLAFAGLAVVALLALLYFMLLLSVRRVIRALEQRGWRIVLGATSILLLGAFTLQRLREDTPQIPVFADPVSLVYAQQVARIRDGLAGSAAGRSLPASPPLQRDLRRLGGADVLVVFLESYGRSTYDRPEFARALAASRAQLAADVLGTRRKVVSAFVESPTFSGGSWLAHMSFMTGIDVRDPERYELLLTQHRETLASAFAAQGYRSIAVMPGLRRTWPEGSFYRFAEIYSEAALRYEGPEFGWWRIPDQFALARVDELELRRKPRAPLFVFFPTISTHLPFRPTPPYQPDWNRVLTPDPYDALPLRESLAQTPDWNDLGAGYMDAMRYSFATLGGYLREQPAAPFILVVLGDHQPASGVSGEGASWDVPVHVITSNAAVIAALTARGFSPGLTPPHTRVGGMHELTQLLLDALGPALPVS